MPIPGQRTLHAIFPTLVLMLALLQPPPAFGQGAGPRVIIDSSPPGATIYIDGKERGIQGYTAPSFKIRLSKGPHRVLLELEGYKAVERVVNVSQAEKLTFPMERAPALLDVHSPGTNDNARGGEVFVDGAPSGTAPVRVEVPSGRHLIEVRKPGYRVYQENVELRAGDTRTLWVTLSQEVKSGSLLVGADTPNAMVYIDDQDQPRGSAPVLLDNLSEGDHKVEVRRAEPGAPPWRQTVRVVAGQQVKVMAHTQGPVQAGGSLLVVSSTAEAEVTVDGTTRGRANQEIGGLRPGQHVIDVRAKGFGAVSKIVDIEAGRQRVEKIELPQSAEGRGASVLRVIMANPVPGAQYFVNGRSVEEGTILNEKGMEVGSGQNIIVVRKENFGEIRKEVSLRPGMMETVMIDLRNVGKIFITSEPRGASVLVDKAEVGRTPYTVQEVGAGFHQVELRYADFPPYIEQVMVRGGEQANVNALLTPHMGGLAKDDPNRRRGQSSFSALTIDPGGFNADFGFGYPYFIDLRLTVGVAKKAFLGLDAGVEFRTTFYETDVNANIRAQIVKAGPIAVGARLLIGGGGGPRKRNGFVFEAGVPITLLAGSLVRITGQPYVQVYSDRLCPSLEDLADIRLKNDANSIANVLDPEHAGDRCTGSGMPENNVIAAGLGYNYDPAAMGYRPFDPGMVMDPKTKGFLTYPTMGVVRYDPNNIPDNYRDGAGGTPLLGRFVGVRFMLQAAIEVALTNNASLWLLVEGAPFQPPRASYTDRFNRVFPIEDFPIYGRLGFSLKF